MRNSKIAERKYSAPRYQLRDLVSLAVTSIVLCSLDIAPASGQPIAPSANRIEVQSVGGANGIAAAPPARAPSNNLESQSPQTARQMTYVLQVPAVASLDIENISRKLDALQGGWWRTVLQTALGGIIALGSAWILQFAKVRSDRQAAKEEAELTVAKTIVDWRLQQLEKLYGPLHILLGQSKGLYRQMNKILLKNAPGDYRFTADEGSSDGQTFEVRTATAWQPFRLITQFSAVYRTGKEVDYLIEQIVVTGRGIVDVIQKNAGLSLPHQNELADAFATYLAHFAVLSRIQEALKDDSKASPALLEAAFPRELPVLVAEGHSYLAAQITAWENRIASTSTL